MLLAGGTGLGWALATPANAHDLSSLQCHSEKERQRCSALAEPEGQAPSLGGGGEFRSRTATFTLARASCWTMTL